MRRNLKNDISIRFLSVFRLYGLGRKKEKDFFFVNLRGERNGCTTIQWWIYIQRSPSTNACRKIKKNEFENPLGIHSLFRFFWFFYFFFRVIKFIPSNMHRMQFIYIFIKKIIVWGNSRSESVDFCLYVLHHLNSLWCNNYPYFTALWFFL